MKTMNSKSLGAALGAGVLTTLALLPQAYGELVYESEIQQPAVVQPALVPPQAQIRVEDRDLTRQTLGASERARATMQSQQRQVVTAQPVVVAQPIQYQAAAQVAPQAAPTTEELQNLSKSELMRRERTREELKNEDILQERLEELRLRDERRRTDQLLGVKSPEAVEPVAPLPFAPAPVASAPIVAPAPGVVAVAPITSQPMIQQPMQIAPAPVTPVVQDQLMVSQAMAVPASVASTSEPSERTLVFVNPRAGLSTLNNEFFEVRPHYSVGLGLGLSVSENLSLELGYTYSEFGVALNNAYYGAPIGAWNPTNPENYSMKQNVADAGLKLHFLGPDAKIRPFIGGGGAYGKSFINYDDRRLSYLNQSGWQVYARDYDLSSFLGFASTGLDIRVNRSISIGASFKYFTVLSSRQNGNLNNYFYGAVPQDPEKQMVGDSMAKASFYSITGGINFVF